MIDEKPLTVAELIVILQRVPSDLEIVTEYDQGCVQPLTRNQVLLVPTGAGGHRVMICAEFGGGEEFAAMKLNGTVVAVAA